MEKTAEELQKELDLLKESLRLNQELLALQKSITSLKKQNKEEKLPDILKVYNGQIILSKGITGKKLTQIINPRIVSVTNFDRLRRIHKHISEAQLEIEYLIIEKLTEKEIQGLDLSINNLLDSIPDYITLKTDNNENMESD